MQGRTRSQTGIPNSSHELFALAACSRTLWPQGTSVPGPCSVAGTSPGPGKGFWHRGCRRAGAVSIQPRTLPAPGSPGCRLARGLVPNRMLAACRCRSSLYVALAIYSSLLGDRPLFILVIWRRPRRAPMSQELGEAARPHSQCPTAEVLPAHSSSRRACQPPRDVGQIPGVGTDPWGGGRSLGWGQIRGVEADPWDGDRSLGWEEIPEMGTDPWGGGRSLEWG